VTATTLSTEQAAVVAAALASARPLTTIGGLAGTGKTTVAAALADRRPTWAVACVAGKAAQQLRSRGIDRAQTVHKLLYISTPRVDCAGRIILDHRGRPTFDVRRRERLACDGILLDEASMLSSALLADLSRHGLPIIAVGDHGQLPPVQGEAWFAEERLDFTLIEQHRADDLMVARALRIRRGQQPAPEAVTVADLLEADQVLCGRNTSRRVLIAMMRAAAGCGPDPEPGERVIVLRNDATTGVMNGNQFRIGEIMDDGMIIRDESGDAIEIDVAADAFERPAPGFRPAPGVVTLTWAAAITVHKAQGSEWDSIVVLDEPIGLRPIPWRYTATTRARHAVRWTRPDLILDARPAVPTITAESPAPMASIV
jgi:exodeoxyribonuclease-5